MNTCKKMLDRVDTWADDCYKETRKLSMDELWQVVYAIDECILVSKSSCMTYSCHEKKPALNLQAKNRGLVVNENPTKGSTLSRQDYWLHGMMESWNKSLEKFYLDWETVVDPLSLSVNCGMTVYDCNDGTPQSLGVQKSRMAKQMLLKHHPRQFRGHVVTKKYKNACSMTYHLRKNKKCPPSPTSNTLSSQGSISGNNWISHRYARNPVAGELDSPNRKRKMDSAEFKQVMCRFCPGKNWLDVDKYSAHLCFAHGIRATRENSGKRRCRIKDFARGHIQREYVEEQPPVKVELLPLPEMFYEQHIRNCIRMHVKCPNCGVWVRLGYSEHSRMIGEEFDDYGSFRSYELQEPFVSSYVTYEAHPSEQPHSHNGDSWQDGLYNRYFRHLVNCDLSFSIRHLDIKP